MNKINLLISFFYDDNQNKDILENYFKAISIVINLNGRQEVIAKIDANNEEEIIQKVSKDKKIPKNMLYSNVYKMKQTE